MGLFQDLRFAIRVLARKPLFAALVVGTLALGIGANSAMFSIIHRLLFEPVSFPERDRLVALQESRRRGGFDEVTPRSFLDWTEQLKSYEQLVAVQWWGVSLTGDGEPEALLASQVSPGFFQMFRVPPLLGRVFAPDEVDGKNVNVVMLSHALWERRYGSDRQIVGKSLRIEGASYVVVGVMPPSFRHPVQSDLWTPLTLTAEQRADRRSFYLNVVGRLRPGVSVEEANAELAALAARHAADFPDSNTHRSARVVGLVASLTEDFTRDFILVLGGAALFVLLITCANVANVFLAHALARRRELAVRAALGAGRARVVRQLLTESALLGVAGGALSLLLAGWVVDLIKGGIPPTTTRYIAGWAQLGVDPTVLAFALVVGVVVGLVFGVAPALQASRIDVAGALKEGDRGSSAGPRTQRLRSVLVVAQVALALALLLTAGAMVKGFKKLARGAFDPEGVLAMMVNLPDFGYARDEEVLALQQRVVERLGALPGATGAGLVNNIPWGRNNWSTRFTVEGHETEPGDAPSTSFRPASIGYLELLRVRKLEGRLLQASDGKDAPRVGVINDAMADRFWPGESAVGKRIKLSGQDEWTTVVGVVGTVEEFVDDNASRPVVYVPAEQKPVRSMYFVVRSAGDPAGLAKLAREALWSVDPNLPVAALDTLRGTRDERMSGLRTGAAMMGGFAFMAALLAVLGIYGVIATLVTQRTHEIGVRLALGAQRRHILRLVVGRGLTLALLGAALGLAGGLGLITLLASVMRRLVAGDALVAVGVTALVLGAALLGSYLPARRATRVDPLEALRGG